MMPIKEDAEKLKQEILALSEALENPDPLRRGAVILWPFPPLRHPRPHGSPAPEDVKATLEEERDGLFWKDLYQRTFAMMKGAHGAIPSEQPRQNYVDLLWFSLFGNGNLKMTSMSAKERERLQFVRSVDRASSKFEMLAQNAEKSKERGEIKKNIKGSTKKIELMIGLEFIQSKERTEDRECVGILDTNGPSIQLLRDVRQLFECASGEEALKRETYWRKYMKGRDIGINSFESARVTYSKSRKSSTEIVRDTSNLLLSRKRFTMLCHAIAAARDAELQEEETEQAIRDAERRKEAEAL